MWPREGGAWGAEGAEMLVDVKKKNGTAFFKEKENGRRKRTSINRIATALTHREIS